MGKDKVIMQNQKAIEQLGYTQKEACVYLGALEIGGGSVTSIAKKLGMPVSSVQVILDKLKEVKLMHFYIKNNRKFWVSEKPGQFLRILNEKQELINEALPSLEAIQAAGRKKRRNDKSSVNIKALQTIADTAMQPVLITNNDAEIIYVNRQWQDLFGYRLNEIKGFNPRILQTEQTPKKVYEQMWKNLQQNKMFQSDKVVDKRKDGSYFKMLTTMFPIVHNEEIYYIQILDQVSEVTRVNKLQEAFSSVTS